MATRTAEREEFLADILVCAVEDYGYNQWRQIAAYNWVDLPHKEWNADAPLVT